MRPVLPLIAAALVVFAFALQTAAVPDARLSAQTDAAQDSSATLTVDGLDQRLQVVEDRNPGGIMAFVLLLFAFFCALWAQNTSRNPWLWFFLGLVFSIITAFVVLHKNSMDLHTNSTPKARPKP